jgi:hypothetical protein
MNGIFAFSGKRWGFENHTHTSDAVEHFVQGDVISFVPHPTPHILGVSNERRICATQYLKALFVGIHL